MEYRYKTRGVCSSEILLELDGDVVKSAKFTGGCNGNLKGICSLIAGMKVDDVIATVVVGVAIAVTAAAAQENDDEDDDPRASAAT